MIEAFSIATAHRSQDALACQARLRHESFIRRRGLGHRSYGGLEVDEFDTRAAVYLVWRDGENIVRGLARLLRTTALYMLQSYWPDLVTERDLPNSPGIFEVTCVCVDKYLAPLVRRWIFPELMCAIQKFLQTVDGQGMIGLTRAHLLARIIPVRI